MTTTRPQLPAAWITERVRELARRARAPADLWNWLKRGEHSRTRTLIIGIMLHWRGPGGLLPSVEELQYAVNAQRHAAIIAARNRYFADPALYAAGKAFVNGYTMHVPRPEPAPEPLQKCRTCGGSFPPGGFPKMDAKRIRSECRVCYNERRRAMDKRNREAVKARTRTLPDHIDRRPHTYLLANAEAWGLVDDEGRPVTTREQIVAMLRRVQSPQLAPLRATG